MGCVSGSCKYGGRLLLAQKIGCGGMLSAAAFCFSAAGTGWFPLGRVRIALLGHNLRDFLQGRVCPLSPFLITLLAGSYTVGALTRPVSFLRWKPEVFNYALGWFPYVGALAHPVSLPGGNRKFLGGEIFRVS